MLKNVDPSKLPREVLEKAVMLADPLRKIYLELYRCKGETSPAELAEKVGFARAYVNMRLRQLEALGYVKSSHKGKRVMFEAIP